MNARSWSDTQVGDMVYFKSWNAGAGDFDYEDARVRVLITNGPQGWIKVHLTIVDEEGNNVRQENNVDHKEEFLTLENLGTTRHWMHDPNKMYYL